MIMNRISHFVLIFVVVSSLTFGKFHLNYALEIAHFLREKMLALLTRVIYLQERDQTFVKNAVYL